MIVIFWSNLNLLPLSCLKAIRGNCCEFGDLKINKYGKANKFVFLLVANHLIQFWTLLKVQLDWRWMMIVVLDGQELVSVTMKLLNSGKHKKLTCCGFGWICCWCCWDCMYVNWPFGCWTGCKNTSLCCGCCICCWSCIWPLFIRTRIKLEHHLWMKCYLLGVGLGWPCKIWIVWFGAPVGAGRICLWGLNIESLYSSEYLFDLTFGP